MATAYFVDPNSIVRKIWGKSDTILLVFAGAAAEFALNKSVDWLYFTGRLPSDPLGRLFSTVSYARAIVFSEQHAAFRAIDSMSAIHSAVETKRGAKIPDSAYRDVLFMLIDYSIRSFEVLERKLSLKEKRDVFDVFLRIGARMQVQGLPESFESWQAMRHDHLQHNLLRSRYTDDLFKQYRNHLGVLRYIILRKVQALVLPKTVRQLINCRKASLMHPLIALYKIGRAVKIDVLLRALILPAAYKKQIIGLNMPAEKISSRNQPVSPTTTYGIKN